MSIAHRIWGKPGADDFLFKFIFFKCYDSLNSVLERAPWHMANRPLVLKKWHPNFSLLKEDLRSVPLWVKLHGVPLEYWTPVGLSHIASAVGKPLHTDKLTASKKRISFARICVEVEASKELPKDFYIQCENGDWITILVEYDWKPQVCTHCKVFGHTNAQCPLLKSSSKPADKDSKGDGSDEWV